MTDRTRLSWFPWNGSKRWLLPELEPIFTEWQGDGRFVEPFVGGGCVSHLIRQVCPEAAQRLNDRNIWLSAAFQAQAQGLLASCIPDDVDAEFIADQRAYTDADADHLTVAEMAMRFAVCLFTAWGNRWETKETGAFRSTVNKKYCQPSYLLGRLRQFGDARWLREDDTVSGVDWSEAVDGVEAGDLVYLDSPYPESLGYGNQHWRFSDHLDVMDWAVEASKRGVSVVISNMGDLERLYSRAGLKTKLVTGPRRSKTRAAREEVIAWKIV